MADKISVTPKNRTSRKKKKNKLVLILIPALILLGVLIVLFCARWGVQFDVPGGKNFTVKYGETYDDSNVRAYFGSSLLFDKLVDLKLEKQGEVDSSTPGEYIVTYSADYLAFHGELKRIVTIKDDECPVIDLTDGNAITVRAGQAFNDPGFKANDNADGDVTSNVEVAGEVDVHVPGDYVLTYTVTDKSGNVAKLERKVTVEIGKQPDEVKPDGKVVYLTFDDGPGDYTMELLDILDKYNVKVTFFVTNNGITDLIKEEAKRGHAIGIHSATHDYSYIYSSDSAFFEDFDKMQSIIVAQTGKATNISRFPGGSSNTVSRKYSSGIMSRLTKAVNNMGFQYFDWNVTSGDAGQTTDTNVVIQNVINGIKNNDTSVVLQHDIKKFSVDAVESIIQWGLVNGYTFLPLDVSSPGAHHGVNN